MSQSAEQAALAAIFLATALQFDSAGVFNLVHGFGPGSAGEFLVSHPGVNAVTFTGESQTGAAIMKSAPVRARSAAGTQYVR